MEEEPRFSWVDSSTRDAVVQIPAEKLAQEVAKEEDSEGFEWSSEHLFSLSAETLQSGLLQAVSGEVERILLHSGRIVHEIRVLEASPIDTERGVTVRVRVFLWPLVNLENLRLEDFTPPQFEPVSPDEIREMEAFLKASDQEGGGEREAVERSLVFERTFSYGKKLERSLMEHIVSQFDLVLPRSLVEEEVQYLRRIPHFSGKSDEEVLREGYFQASVKGVLLAYAEEKEIGERGGVDEERLLSALDSLLSDCGYALSD